VKKIIFYLFLLFLFIYLLSDTFFIYPFNSNLFPEGEKILYSSYNGFSLDFDSISNIYFFVVFDLSFNSKIFFSPSSIDYQHKKIFFNLKNDSQIYFYELFDLPSETIITEKNLARISFLNDLKALNFIISRYFQFNGFTNDYEISSHNSNDKNMLNILFNIQEFYEKKDFESLKILFEKLKRKYPENRDFYQLYILSLMDCSNFSRASFFLDSYFKKFEDDTFYYSLKGNIYAIMGNLKKAEQILKTGRKKYPDSFVLLNDLLNVYSITDSIKFTDFKNYLNLKLKKE